MCARGEAVGYFFPPEWRFFVVVVVRNNFCLPLSTGIRKKEKEKAVSKTELITNSVAGLNNHQKQPLVLNMLHFIRQQQQLDRSVFPQTLDSNLSILVAGSCRLIKAFGPARVHEVSGMQPQSAGSTDACANSWLPSGGNMEQATTQPWQKQAICS